MMVPRFLAPPCGLFCWWFFPVCPNPRKGKACGDPVFVLFRKEPENSIKNPSMEFP